MRSSPEANQGLLITGLSSTSPSRRATSQTRSRSKSSSKSAPSTSSKRGKSKATSKSALKSAHREDQGQPRQLMEVIPPPSLSPSTVNSIAAGLAPGAL